MTQITTIANAQQVLVFRNRKLIFLNTNIFRTFIERSFQLIPTKRFACFSYQILWKPTADLTLSLLGILGI